MNSLHSSCWNTSAELMNKSWNKEFAYQTLRVVDIVLLPAMIGIICSTDLVGNIFIVFTIIRLRKKTIPDIYICNLAVADLVHITGMPFLIHQWAWGGEWAFGEPLCTIITSLDTCNQFACKCHHDHHDCGQLYSPSVPRQRVMKLAKMVLVLVAVFILSAAPYHVLQLLNLQMQQTTLVSYCLSICLSYASSSINPFLYVLLSGNFRKRLPGVQS